MSDLIKKTVNGNDYWFRRLKLSARLRCEKHDSLSERFSAAFLETLVRPDGTPYSDMDELSEDVWIDDFEDLFEEIAKYVFGLKRKEESEQDPVPLPSESDSVSA